MKKKLRMFLCAALAASMMATAPALVQAAEEKETTETAESNAVRQDLAGLKYDHSLELQYADQFSVDYYEGGYALITIVGDGQFLLVPKGKKLRRAWTVILQLLNSHLIISILWQHRQWIFSVHWTGWTVSVFQEPMLTDGISTRLRKHWKMEVFLLLVSTVHRITN